MRRRPGLSCVLAMTVAGGIVSTQSRPRETAAQVTQAGKAGGVKAFVTRLRDGVTTCQLATPSEIQTTIPNLNNGGVPVEHLLPAELAKPHAENAAVDGLTIQLNALSQLQTDANRNTVIAAFQRAAGVWTARIKTPITIKVNIDYGVDRPNGSEFPEEVVGSTSSGTVAVDYPLARATLIGSSSGATESAIYSSLPSSSVPVNTGNGSVIEVARSLGQALGFVPLDANTAVATISFNKNMPFDFNPDNGIGFDRLDFVGTAAHEIGHALGFISNAGDGATAPLTTWDLFRFRSGTTPNTFQTAQRIMSIGGSQVFYTTQTFRVEGLNTTEVSLSNGGPDGDGGDGNQSSHWKGDEITGRYIGVMDPTIGLGERSVTTDNDFSALETFGWNLVSSVTPPAPLPAAYNDDFDAAHVLIGCSGTLTGTNLNSTRETGEPNHLSTTNGNAGRHSIWYQWQAPSSGSVTFTTAGSAYDTVLGVYMGTGVSALTIITQNDDIPDVPGQPHQVTSSVSFSVAAGNTYRIAVDGFNNGGDGGDMGPFKLNWFQSSCDEPARFLIPQTDNPNIIAAFDAVTFVGAPFRIHNPNNFSSDQRTTVMFLINGLTFTSADNPDTIRVEAGNRTLFVHRIGAFTAPGLSATYVIFAFPLDLPPGNYPLNVRVRNVPCINSPLISIAGP
ncbi:MAG TPA: NF038122 family metalloprotease [Pyrinomonadaceae bacterium]